VHGSASLLPDCERDVVRAMENTAVSPSTLPASGITVMVVLPALLRIDVAENSSFVQQIAVPSWSGEASVQEYTQGRMRGYSITASDGSTATLLLTNGSQPSAEWTRVLRLRDTQINPSGQTAIDLSDAKWIRHPDGVQPLNSHADCEGQAAEAIASWTDAFRYKREDVALNIDGLRPPQVGAIYAIQAHWTINVDPATVVLPTGVGKTETMLSVLVAERCQRLLVVVPTDALRTQIAEKFLTLGLLKTPAFTVVLDNARYPVVGTLNKRPTNVAQVDSFFRKCNVVITTMPLASQCSPEVMQRMAELCPCLFIDEAHHVGAPTWKAFRDVFAKNRVIQFTATPFRNDDEPIGGKRIFTFSLRHAQEQNYFKQIHFKPVTEFDLARRDTAIADAAVEQLREDAALGHILMARVANISRAEEVFKCYEKYPEFNPVQIHTGIKSKMLREEIRRKLVSGESRIVVCVDMLGEGFDLPELKIAAFHDIRKTLAVTLQLVGRFTRSKPHLGNATIIANIADLDVKSELKRLYQHDSDWNVLLPLMNERVTEGEFNLWEFLGGFQDLPEEITLRNVRPAMSTVVYRTKCTDWNPENFREGIPAFDSLDKVYHTLNPQENTLIVVTTRRVSVDWAQIDEIHNWDWQLYVLHWHREKGLLFIHNSSNAGFFKDLAKAVAGEDVEQIRGPKIFRCLAGINRFKLQNAGLLETLGRLVRYTMRAGCDVDPGISEAQRRKAIKANLFGQGFENGQRSSIGCSYKGRIWSYRTANLLTLTTWCRAVGARLLNEQLDPEEVLRGTLVPQLVSERPRKMPIAVEWPTIFYKEPEQMFAFQINGSSVYRHDADIELSDPSEDGPLAFSITSAAGSATFQLQPTLNEESPDFSIQSVDGGDATITSRGQSVDLRTFFEEHLPTFWFADGSSLTGIEYVPLPKQTPPFPRDRIQPWDWTGTKIRKESQGIERNPESIQFRVISELKKRKFTVILDDDDHGEAADVVGIAEEDDHIQVEFWHCKFATADKPGSRIGELYALCGQAQTSIRWLEKPRDLFSHFMRREPRRYMGKEGTRYEVGTERDLLRIREKVDVQPIRLRVFIVQPGLSVAEVSREQLELLAVTESYLVDTFAVPLEIIGSD
jgi:superfamily II DNA or RNA helicase